MRSAVELEASTEKHNITPGPIVTARELLGRHADGRRAGRPPPSRPTRRRSRVAPNRFKSLYGVAKAAERAGDRAKAKEYYGEAPRHGERPPTRQRPELAGGESVQVIASARHVLVVAVAAAAWHRLLDWVAKTAGVDLTLMDQSDPTPLDELWARARHGLRVHVRLSLGVAPRSARAARVARALAPALWRPRRLRHRLHRARRRPAQDPRRYVRRHHRVLHRALALRRTTRRASICSSTCTPERRALYRTVLGPYVRQRPVIDAVMQGRGRRGGRRRLRARSPAPPRSRRGRPACAWSRAPRPRRARRSWPRRGSTRPRASGSIDGARAARIAPRRRARSSTTAARALRSRDALRLRHVPRARPRGPGRRLPEARVGGS